MGNINLTINLDLVFKILNLNITWYKLGDNFVARDIEYDGELMYHVSKSDSPKIYKYLEINS